MAIHVNRDATGSQSFTQASGTLIQTGNNTSSAISIDVLGTGSAAIADIRANTTTGEIVITAVVGSITDSSTGEAANLTAFAAALRAGTGIGDAAFVASDIDTVLSRIAAVTDSGDIALDNSGVLEVGTVNGLSGLTMTDTANNNSGADDILLTTTGSL